MIKQLFLINIKLRWKRFLLVFLATALASYNTRPTYMDYKGALSSNDWMLEVSGTMLIMYFFAPLMVILLTFDLTQWLWSYVGTSALSKLEKRNTLFWSYVAIILGIVTFVVVSIVFWGYIIGYVRYNGFAAMDHHLLLTSKSSPSLFVFTHFVIDFFGLFFIAMIGLFVAFLTKNIVFSFIIPYALSFFLLMAFKGGLGFKGLFPGEGILLNPYFAGTSAVLILIANAVYTIFVLFVLYGIINRISLVMPRTGRG
ncbi:hypothetical protein A374_06926 [Fictibacillus macauensis ZFHKF-1]|uniref:Uncharacterized protein n=1 Tax=Fictibacillus macauensis ZFHKF-1 TaxID=1196324 RepID=I8UGV4_9BACL|nr:hypothetical protein [Fictibacillus macauensis]EIT86033.1 hypothetical protein A374_06926 [Fictibacillus macauensis ZFHKF-1]